MTALPKPPKHLLSGSKAWWRLVARDYALSDHQYRLLTAAAESWDRKEAAREAIERDGLTFTSKYGEVRPHPAVAIERDSRLAFARLVRELALADVEEPSDTRPPRLAGRYAGRA